MWSERKKGVPNICGAVTSLSLYLSLFLFLFSFFVFVYHFIVEIIDLFFFPCFIYLLWRSFMYFYINLNILSLK